MPVPMIPVPWVGSLLWLLGLGVAAFAVSEIAATICRLGRGWYIAVLTVVTAGLTAGYVAWAQLDAGQLLTRHWGWGLLAAPLSAGLLIVGMARLPVARRYAGRALGEVLLWEAVVYGIAEGVLLSALPVLITWEMVDGLGWSGVVGTVARAALPLAASVVVIIVHHLGYPEYRNRMLRRISVGCGLLSLGYLVTGSPVAPLLGHVLAHGSGLLHGAELPPHPGQPRRTHDREVIIMTTSVSMEQYQQAERDIVKRQAWAGLRVHAIVTGLVWVGVILLNVLIATGFPWSVFVILGTGLGVVFHWYGYRHAEEDTRRQQVSALDYVRTHAISGR